MKPKGLIEPCPECGWKHPIVRAQLGTIRRTDAHTAPTSEPGGFLGHCPLCETLYAVTSDIVKVITRRQQQAPTPRPGSRRNGDELPPQHSYPNVPSDMERAFEHREPA